jgi:hypothetical protein
MKCGSLMITGWVRPKDGHGSPEVFILLEIIAKMYTLKIKTRRLIIVMKKKDMMTQ